METFVVAAVQAAYVLMDRDATIDRVAELTAEAAREGARLVVLPEAFVPGTPFWIDSRPIWDGDADWYALLVENAVVVPGPADRPARGDRARARGVARRGGPGARAHGGHDLQHGALLLPRRRAGRPAPQARADRFRTHRVGDGRRVDPAHGPHPAGPAGRADLLGELHAAGPLPPLRAGRRRVARADAGAGRRLGRHHAAPRPREPDVRHRRQPGPARRPGPGRLPAPRPARPRGLPRRGLPLGRARQHA